jgi:hypothetical protein
MDPTRSWAALPAKEDATEKDFFLVSTTCILGDGESTLFWTGPCLDGCCVGSVLAELLNAVPPRKIAHRMVVSGLQSHA